MMYRRSKKSGNRSAPASMDWQQFQARIEKLLSAFQTVAGQDRPQASPAEKPTAVQPRAHLPTVLERVGIKLDEHPTRAQMVTALASVIDACRRVEIN
jgi:hypothetical protein